MEEMLLTQRSYSAVIEHFIKTGRAPHYTELAATLGVLPEEARRAQHHAAEASLACWFVKDTDYVESWAPFSNVPTPYLVSVEGEQKWYGQWGLEALAVRWLFPDKEVRIDSRCLDCGEPIRVRMRNEDVLEVNPETAVGHINIPLAQALSGNVPWGLAWSRMNLFRSEDHVKNWPSYDPVSAESIIPVAGYAQAFSGPLFKNRRAPDYLSRIHEYAGEFIRTLQEMGKGGPFWIPA